jgi:hypothetical protein
MLMNVSTQPIFQNFPVSVDVSFSLKTETSKAPGHVCWYAYRLKKPFFIRLICSMLLTESLNCQKLAICFFSVIGIVPHIRDRHTSWTDFKPVYLVRVSRDSSVGIATGYGLDDQGQREFESP